MFILLLLPLATLSGCKYYQDTYKGEEYYSIVPQQVPAREQTKDKDGKIVEGSYSYNYQLKWADKDGKVITKKYELSGKSPTPLTPGRYIKAEISKKRIVEGPNYIEQNEVPKKALEKIQ